MKRPVQLAAFAFWLGIALPAWAQSAGSFSTLTTTGTATMGGDVLMCSGRPWIDVRCNGAVGDDSHDDTTAINATIAAAITNNWPVHFPAGTYKVSSAISIDYAGQASKGFRLISEGATIDGRARLWAGTASPVRRRLDRQPHRVLLLPGRGDPAGQWQHPSLCRGVWQNRFLRRT